MKMKLSGFVILNSGHRKICFTYFYHFEYSTNSLIGEQSVYEAKKTILTLIL